MKIKTIVNVLYIKCLQWYQSYLLTITKYMCQKSNEKNISFSVFYWDKNKIACVCINECMDGWMDGWILSFTGRYKMLLVIINLIYSKWIYIALILMTKITNGLIKLYSSECIQMPIDI